MANPINWYAFRSFNTETLYGWGTKLQAELFCDRLNRKREINVYQAVKLDEPQAEELDLAERDDTIDLEVETATAEGTYTLVMMGDCLMLCVPDGTDVRAAIKKLGEEIREEIALADCHIEDGLILTDEEPEDRDRIAWRGHSMGCVGDINDRTYEYAIRQE